MRSLLACRRQKWKHAGAVCGVTSCLNSSLWCRHLATAPNQPRSWMRPRYAHPSTPSTPPWPPWAWFVSRCQSGTARCRRPSSMPGQLPDSSLLSMLPLPLSGWWTSLPSCCLRGMDIFGVRYRDLRCGFYDKSSLRRTTAHVHLEMTERIAHPAARLPRNGSRPATTPASRTAGTSLAHPPAPPSPRPSRPGSRGTIRPPLRAGRPSTWQCPSHR